MTRTRTLIRLFILACIAIALWWDVVSMALSAAGLTLPSDNMSAYSVNYALVIAVTGAYLSWALVNGICVSRSSLGRLAGWAVAVHWAFIDIVRPVRLISSAWETLASVPYHLLAAQFVIIAGAIIMRLIVIVSINRSLSVNVGEVA